MAPAKEFRTLGCVQHARLCENKQETRSLENTDL